MKIESLYRTDVITAEPRETLLDAARRMEWLEVSCLPIVEEGELIGIITERDVLRAVASGLDPTATDVARSMTLHPFVAHPGDDSAEVARRMLDLGVRHLPVMEGGELVGIVSARDLLALEAWAAEKAWGPVVVEGGER